VNGKSRDEGERVAVGLGREMGASTWGQGGDGGGLILVGIFWNKVEEVEAENTVYVVNVMTC
jgi:hypothetical protein